MRYNPNEQIESQQKYILQGGVPVSCTCSEWEAWLDSENGRKESVIGNTKIVCAAFGGTESVHVLTTFCGCFCGPRWKRDETLLFITSATASRFQSVVSRWRSLKAARSGHRRWVTTMNKGGWDKSFESRFPGIGAFMSRSPRT